MRHKGRITTWKDDKGFGFITPSVGGEQVFVHIRAFSNRQRRPIENDLVTYELGADERGRRRALSAAFVGENVKKASGRLRDSRIPPLFALVFLMFVVAAALAGKLPAAVVGIYLLASLVAFVAYAVDKSAAREGRWRTQESTLHVFSLVGGWPGALMAQRLFRHKSAKATFQAKFWVTVALNCGALIWLLTPFGARVLQSVAGAVKGMA